MLVEVGIDLDRAGVQPRLVGEGRQTNIRLTSARWNVRHLCDGMREAGCLPQRASRKQRPAVLEFEVGDHRDQLGVAGALAVAVDGALHVHDARVDSGEGVGDRAAGVVVSVDAERDADLVRRGDDLADPRRQHAAVGVTQHHDLGTGLGRGPDGLQRVRRILAVSVEEVLAVDEDPLALGAVDGARCR